MHSVYHRLFQTRSLMASAFLALSLSAVAQTSAPDQPAVSPKKPGLVRVGIAMPKYDMGAPGNPAAGEPIRAAEQQFLTSANVEVVKLSALLPVQATAEAKALDCDYVLTSSVTQKAKTGGFGGLRTLSSLAPMAATMVPKIGVATSLAGLNAASAMQQTLSLVTSAAVKAKAEVTFDYSLTSVAGGSPVSDSEKAKAKNDGEDVITPMIQQAATRILAALSK